MADTPTAEEQPVATEKLHEDGIVGHLVDLRNSAVWSLIVFAVAFMGMFPFAEEIYNAFVAPLLAKLPENAELIATGLLGPFVVPLKVVAFCAFCVTLPHTLFQLWRFVAPGLYRKEKGFAMPVVISSTLLFFLGASFAYLLVFKVVFEFIFNFAPTSIRIMPDVQNHLDFALLMFLIFGVAFEVPVVVFLLVRGGIVDIAALRKARSYVIAGAFVVAAIITPPDVISQFMLALPVWLLYEIGIQVAQFFPPPKSDDDDDEDDEAVA